MLSTASASALRRPALLAGSAVRLVMASPLWLGLGLQPALMFRPQQSRLLLPSRGLWLSASPYARSNNDGGRSHNGSSSSSCFPSSRVWYLASAVPFLTVASDTPPPINASRPSSSSAYGLPLNPEFVSEVSRGSIIGFLVGLLVSTFSKTLVLLLGAAIAVQSLAARAGIDLVHHLQLKQRFNSSRILTSLAQHTAFKLAFSITFALSAFMSF